tara:strand:- start:232 stop:1068 length:837 start_codon:yes stop_codon:yes gene_type:complete
MASWNKLADRCRLFTDRPRALLIELLKEAEEELVRKCDILEKEHSFTAPLLSGANVNFDVLPNNYKKEIAVFYKGVKLNKMSQEEVVLNTSNQIYTGTPTSYWIEGNQIHFNKIPSSSDQFKMHYYARLGNTDVAHSLRVFNFVDSSTDYIYLDTDLGSELTGLFGTMPGILITIGSFEGLEGNNDGSKYIITQVGTLNDSSTKDIKIKNYRSVAPIIPDHFHRNLCDYAIALSTPELHDKHMIMFENSINEIKNEDAERDLVHEVKKEVYNSANLYR